ncbi:helix-turn-helix domain-containing protein [Salinarimonas ramus]|uniref:HTH iclR-type domain-containing protein n=1 Tax=Salinarimonas ramus TaxID=690164 RepID=A0A917Q607_9HYPH|nr:helix-turn-helix domain-containing protein [Salinarimonas ramus]GGK28235.1 hypothetical protein GCM10011322_13440 [Salinarimonas ramus]
MPKHNAKGRSKNQQRFVALPLYMLRSAAWRSLSPVARCAFIEVASLYNGGNNGRLALSARDAAERIGCSKDTAARALAALTERGFIEQTRPGSFHRKTPHAAEYRLTLYSCDQSGALPSRAFARWQPNEKQKPVLPQGQPVLSQGQ